MLRLPLLIRILPVGNVEEEMKVGRGVLEVTQVVISRRPQEICHRSFRQQQFGPGIQRTDDEWVVLAVIGGKR